MTLDEIQFQRSRLAIETRLRREDQRLARERLSHEKRQTTGLKALFTPAGGVFVAATLGLLGTAAAKWGDNAIEHNKQQTAIILKASEVSATLTPEQQEIQRARNLLWFATWDYLQLPDALLQELKAKAGLKKGQPIPPPIIQPASTTARELLSQFEGSPTESVEEQIGGATAAIARLVKVKLSENQESALISFVANVGVPTFANSTALDELNNGNYAAVPELMRKYGRGTFSMWERRREKEIELWNKQ